MKKTYESPALLTEQFDVEDVITVSSPAAEPTLTSTHNNFPVVITPEMLDITLN